MASRFQGFSGPVSVTDERGVTVTYPNADAAEKGVPAGVVIERKRGGAFIKPGKATGKKTEE